VNVDGNEEGRKGTVSVFDGPPPKVLAFESAEEESKAVGAWIAARLKDKLRPEEIGVFVRSEAELDRARAAAKFAGSPRWLYPPTAQSPPGALRSARCISPRVSSTARSR
jgi:hypothetical protein